MPKVYVLSTGEYSDWSIEGIYDEKHKKQAEEEQLNIGEYANDIEEYELNKPVNPKEGWKITYTPHNEIWNVSRSSIYKMNEVQQYKHYMGNEYVKYCVYIKAKDRKAALKIGNEKVSQYIAKVGLKTNDELELEKLEEELSRATVGSYVSVSTFERYNELKYKKRKEGLNGETDRDGITRI